MPATARILLLDQTPAVDGLMETISAMGYTAIAGTSGDTPAAAVAGHRPDLVVIDNNGKNGDGFALTKLLKKSLQTSIVPVIFICSGDSSDEQAKAFEAGADHVIKLPMSNAGLLSRVRSSVRLHNMHAELMRRRDAMERFTIDVPPESLDTVDLTDARVMLIGRAIDPRLADIVGEILGVDHVTDPREGLGRLSDRPYDAAVVFAGPGEAREMLALCADMRNNVSLFNLPLVLILSEDGAAEANAAYNAWVSDVLVEPVNPAELKQRVLAWVRQHRYRRQLFQWTDSATHTFNLDGLTGLYSHGFMRDYLNSLIEDCEITGKGFSVGFFEIRHMMEINHENGYSAGDHLLRQIGQTIGRLVRAEDLPARYRGKEFCVILPETPLLTARKVIDRIAGIVHSTDFLVMGCVKVLKLDLAFGAAEYNPGEKARDLLDRAQSAAS